MAMVAELSMHQANALRLQQQVKDKEAELEQCYLRMEKGEPPSDEIEQEWIKLMSDNIRRSEEKEAMMLVSSIFILFQLIGSIKKKRNGRHVGLCVYGESFDIYCML